MNVNNLLQKTLWQRLKDIFEFYHYRFQVSHTCPTILIAKHSTDDCEKMLVGCGTR